MEDLVGRTLGHYRVQEPLGSGGMGQVYVAYDTKLGREVALKVLPPDMASDPDRLSRFEHEARTLASLDHPSIVTVHSIEEDAGLRFLTMQRIRGQSLRHAIPAAGLPLARFFHIAVPLADALGAAHQKGITHRDLKPDNVMVSEDGRVKVLDFGLAKSAQPALVAAGEEVKTASITADGRIVGTVAYMSPEQAQGQPVDHRSDIFSLGILLYEMATGKRPFKGSTNLSILSAILREQPMPITEVKADLPRPLARMIQRALEKNPTDRYQSALDLRQDLDDLRRDVESGEVSSGSGLRALVLGPPGRPVGLARTLGGVSLLALLIGGAAYFVGRGEERRSVNAGEASDQRPSVAVFYFENLSGDASLDWLRTALAEMLVTDLSQSPRLRVLGTARLQQILGDLGRSEVRAPSLELIQRVAHEARVATALVGNFVRAGDRLRISVSLQDAASGELLAAERVEGDGEAAVFRLVDDLTHRIKTRLAVARAAGEEPDRDLKEVTTASVEAYRHYAEGYALHIAGREEQALPHLEKAVEVDPNFAMALAKLAIVHGNLGDMEKCEAFGKRALEHVERLTAGERYYIEGVYYARRPEHLLKSVEAYQMAVERFPDHHAARHNLAQNLMMLRRYDEALAHFEELRRQKMTFPGTYQSLAATYALVGEPNTGLAVLEDYVKQKPDNPSGHLYLAYFLAGLERFDQALPAADRAQALGAGARDVAELRFVTHLAAGRVEDAAAEAAKLEALGDNQSRSVAHFSRAVLAGYAGQLETVLAELDAVGASSPGSKIAKGSRFLAVDVLLLAGRPADALARLVRLRTTVSGPEQEAGVRILSATALAALGRSAEAATELQTAHERLKALPEGLIAGLEQEAQGHVLLARGEFQAAARAYREVLPLLPKTAVELSPDAQSTRVRYALGVACFESGLFDEAAEQFSQLAMPKVEGILSPLRAVRSLYYLGRIEEERGNAAKAHDYFHRFHHSWREGTLDREWVKEAGRKVG